MSETMMTLILVSNPELEVIEGECVFATVHDGHFTIETIDGQVLGNLDGCLMPRPNGAITNARPFIGLRPDCPAPVAFNLIECIPFGSSLNELALSEGGRALKISTTIYCEKTGDLLSVRYADGLVTLQIRHRADGALDPASSHPDWKSLLGHMLRLEVTSGTAGEVIHWVAKRFCEDRATVDALSNTYFMAHHRTKELVQAHLSRIIEAMIASGKNE